MPMKYIYDTNSLLHNLNLLDLEGEKIIPLIVIRELDRLKIGTNDLAYKARNAIRKLKSTDIIIDYDFDVKENQLNDDVVLDCATKYDAAIISDDYVVQLKAKARNIAIYAFDEQKDEYNGYLEITMNDEELADFYENLNINKYNLLINQYMIIRNKNNEVVDTVRWDGNEIKLAHHKGFTTNMFGKFKPLDSYQVCALDSLINNQMTMIKGKAGSGKSLIALNYAWSQIEKGKFDKLIVFTNPVASRFSAKLGYYPGTRDEKLLDSNVGSMLASKFGDVSQIEMLINNGKLVLIPFADLRGFDSTGMKAIIWVIESQNLDIELMKLGIQRVGDDCKLIIDGDYDSQVDLGAYEGMNNGMRRVSEVFRGKDFYGEVKLPNVYRSKMAQVADLL